MSLLHGALNAGRRRPLGTTGAGAGTVTPAALSMVKLLVVSLVHPTLSYAAPIFARGAQILEEEGETVDGPNLWVYLGVAAALVLLGGAFAGLTIALMGQDEIYLQVIATSGEGTERKNAARVLRLLKRGKHWVLVTLLLSNVITNETLPIVLDRSLGGGWPAVLGSTVLIVIFGEIAPQSVCVRYGLPIGAFMSGPVLALMWLMAPVAWPTAKLLDWLLGEDHGTTYKKAGLKTLVTLHKTLGTDHGERLNEDEVTIITAVLDLKDKPVGAIMTPMQDVFTMSADTVLDEKMMDTILSQGYSRIPIYAPEDRRNYIGMLLVKILITYDPEDALRVRDFALATLPETAPDTSCLDIVNFFQEGKSHMVLVSDFPGQNKGAMGVVTLEDVIEELIGEEIIDESDVFVDVHKAIRRMAPAPRTRYNKAVSVKGDDADTDYQSEPDERTSLLGGRKDLQRKVSANGSREATVLMRRRSSLSTQEQSKPVPVRSNTADLRQHLKHLGPSNVASRPKATKYAAVKIKPGVGTIPEGQAIRPRSINDAESQRRPSSTHGSFFSHAPEGGAGAGLLDDAGKDAKDGALAVATGHGTTDSTPKLGTEDEVVASESFSRSPPKSMTAREASALAEHHTSSELTHNKDSGNQDKEQNHGKPEDKEEDKKEDKTEDKLEDKSEDKKDDEDKRQEPELPERLIVEGSTSRPISSNGRERSGSSSSRSSTIGEMESHPRKVRGNRTARSGSITENIIDVNGMKKVVLETTSSSDDTKRGAPADGADDAGDDQNYGDHDDDNGGSKRKKKKKRAGKKFRNKENKHATM